MLAHQPVPKSDLSNKKKTNFPLIENLPEIVLFAVNGRWLKYWYFYDYLIHNYIKNATNTLRPSGRLQRIYSSRTRSMGGDR